jgi:hypothetical protein
MSAAASGVPADVSEPPDLRDARNILPVRGRNADCYPYRVVRGVRRDRIFDRVLGRLGFGLPCFHAPGVGCTGRATARLGPSLPMGLAIWGSR